MHIVALGRVALLACIFPSTLYLPSLGIKITKRRFMWFAMDASVGMQWLKPLGSKKSLQDFLYLLFTTFNYITLYYIILYYIQGP